MIPIGPHRKKFKRIEQGSARFLTFSCYKRIQLLDDPQWRDDLAATIGFARNRLGFKLIAWVIMPEHVHLVVIPSEHPVSKILVAIKQPTAQRAIKAWRKSDSPILQRLMLEDGRHRFWQAGGGFDRNIRSQDELAREVSYIHMNPVRRGLVNAPEEWAWSSANWYAGNIEGEIPIDRVSL